MRLIWIPQLENSIKPICPWIKQSSTNYLTPFFFSQNVHEAVPEEIITQRALYNSRLAKLRQKFNELNLLREATRVEDNEDTETVRSRLPMPHFDQRTPELRKGICIFQVYLATSPSSSRGYRFESFKDRHFYIRSIL